MSVEPLFASLVKGGGLPQGKPEGFSQKIDFKKKVLRCLIPQSSSMTAPDGSPSPLSLRDISPHRGESPFTREPEQSLSLLTSFVASSLYKGA
jgi:hypothetical protein